MQFQKSIWEGKMKISFRSIWLLPYISLLVGCSSYSTKIDMTAEVGNPIDENAVQEITIGETTRSEVFALLGTPHSIFQDQAELRPASL